MAARHVFVTGATGYIGRALIPLLSARGHVVRALARPGSERKLPPGCIAVVGDALAAASYADRVAPADTFVHLVGVSHPAPWKRAAFSAIDLASVRVALAAARAAGVRHFIYVSVAHPAPVMRAYIDARRAAEALIRAAGMAATIVRPWYVLGPGHRWPYVLLPVYALLECLPPTREPARRLGLVTRGQMTAALAAAVEQPRPDAVSILDVPAIKRASW